MPKKKQTKSGSALIFATIILFSLLAITVTLSAITVSDMKMSQKTKSSTGAFFNADSGIEWALNKIANNSGTIISAFSSFSAGKTPCPSGFSCDVFLLDSDGKVITIPGTLLSEVKAVRSVGTQGGETQRAIEAAVAATGGGCYTSYGKPPVANRAEAGSNDNDYCIIGFINKGLVGKWGASYYIEPGIAVSSHFLPPAGGSHWGVLYSQDAYICCQS